jgi:hypothetical protein
LGSKKENWICFFCKKKSCKDRDRFFVKVQSSPRGWKVQETCHDCLIAFLSTAFDEPEHVIGALWLDPSDWKLKRWAGHWEIFEEGRGLEDYFKQILSPLRRMNHEIMLGR